MGNKKSYLEFIESEDFKNQADVWYKAYNITRERTELFNDFVLSLYELVESTYMGPELLSSEIDQRNHFNWCWGKIISNLEKESIYLRERGEHYDYLWLFFQEAFYINDVNSFRIKEYFTKLFSFNFKKTRSELDIFTEIYKLLEHNLKK